MTKPFVITLAPLPGESLISLVARNSEANLLPRPSDVLAELGIQKAVPSFLAFAHQDAAPTLAAGLGVHVSEIAGRMHPCVDSTDGRRVDFYGVALERRLLEATKRRFSPGALRQSAHARSSWMIRPLPFCPETMELLVDRCGTCGAGLTWQRCRTITKCEQCNSSLLTMEASTVPNDQREAARLCAKLVSDSEADRREALVAYPEPFNAWAAGDLFMAIVEFGLAVTTPDAQISRTNKKTGTGDFADFGLPDLLAGHDFAMRWPASLLEFVQDRYVQTKSASLRSCFGTLDKFFNPTSPPSPVRELLRANLSSAIELARVPVKQCVLKSRNCVSATTINAREAEARFGLFRAQLRRLQGGSETFVGGRSARGGTALYDIERLTQMARLRDSSLSTRQAAKALGIPIHVVGELAASGFIEEVADRDIALAFEELRYTRSSIEVLEGRLQHLQCGRVEAAATVERVLHGYADPQAWSRLLSGVLGGSVAIAGRTLAPSPIGRLIVDRKTAGRRLKGLPSRTLTGAVSSVAAAKILGTSPQLVIAAVRAGVLSGRIVSQNSQIDLEDISRFSRTFILNAEICRRLDCSQPEVGARLRAFDIGPLHKLGNGCVWDRGEFDEKVGVSSDCS